MKEAAVRYEGERAGYGDLFLENVQKSLDLIKSSPLAHENLGEGVRRSKVRKFPYGVYYIVEGRQIEVFAVYHDHRDPEGWKSRVRRT